MISGISIRSFIISFSRFFRDCFSGDPGAYDRTGSLTGTARGRIALDMRAGSFGRLERPGRPAVEVRFSGPGGGAAGIVSGFQSEVFKAAKAKSRKPAIISVPPIGVTAPSQRGPPRARPKTVPLKI